MVSNRNNNRNIKLSIVAPVFNESESIFRFCESLRGVMSNLNDTYEVIFIDDGSTDGSFDKLSKLAWPEMRVLGFVKNSGHQSALDAGYRVASGDYVVTFDSDMEHPPELSPQLYKVAVKHNVDVV